jgi:hypothetical protein
MKTLQLAAAVIALALTGCTQVTLARLYFANTGTRAEVHGGLPLELPYRDHDGWVVVPVKVNGQATVDFVLDTGASLVALIEGPGTAGLRLDMSGVQRLGAEGDLAAPVGARQDGLTLTLGDTTRGVTLHGQTALALPLASLGCKGEGTPAPPFGGVLGYDLFRRYVVEVDRDRGVVVLHDPETYAYAGEGTVVPAPLSARQPFLQAEVRAPGSDAPYTARLHVDTGAGIDVTLLPGTHPSITVPAGGAVKEACFVGGLARYQTGTSAALSLAGGPQAETPVEYALGKEVVASGQHGRIGARFLARYNVVIDYARERLVLTPRRRA